MVNVELLESTMQYIKDHPEEHNQTVWTCETGACFAGHVVLRSGYQVARQSNGLGGFSVINGLVVDGEGYGYHVHTLAEKLLGLSMEDANIIFDGRNTAGQLELMVKDLANGEELLGNWTWQLDQNEGKSFCLRKGERVDA